MQHSLHFLQLLPFPNQLSQPHKITFLNTPCFQVYSGRVVKTSLPVYIPRFTLVVHTCDDRYVFPITKWDINPCISWQVGVGCERAARKRWAAAPLMQTFTRESSVVRVVDYCPLLPLTVVHGWPAGLRRWCCHAMSKRKTRVTSRPLIRCTGLQSSIAERVRA